MSEIKFYEYSKTKNPNHLVILLHGYGANGENLLSLSHDFQYAIADAHFISPNAIEPWEGGFPDSYQWFSLFSGVERKEIFSIGENIKRSNQILLEFITKQLDRFKLDFSDLFLVGFSQGAMMAMYQGFIMPKKIAGIVAYSGKLILPEIVGEKIISKPEICLIHGKSDSVVPFENFLEAEKILQQKEIKFESHAIENLDHSIDIHGVKIANKFFTKFKK